MAKQQREDNCSFCLRPRSAVDMLITGREANICNDCLEQGLAILREEKERFQKESLETDLTWLKPSAIKSYLDDYIIGQDEAKTTLAVAVYNHYKRVMAPSTSQETEEVELEKSNVMLVGETGTGKTLIARTIARMLDVPFCIADATVLTEAGYVGEDVESVLTRLLQAADYQVEKAERGIVFIDEIDKIARKGDNPSLTRDVSGEGVQQGLLKLLEGSVIGVPPQGGRKHPEQKLIQVDTKNILFICGGAFEGIEHRIASRLSRQSIGFSAEERANPQTQNLLQFVTPQDVKSFGLIPELVGRIPVVTHLNPLNAEALKRILTEPKNALIKQYQRLLSIDHKQLTIEPDVLDLIVEKAMEYKLGARGLRSLCEAIMKDVMYHAPDSEEKEFVVSLEFAKSQLAKSSFGSAA